VDIRGFAETLNLLSSGFNIDARMLAELLQHLEHHGEFLFGEHSNLKIEMGAPLRLARHAILANQHEDGQEHAFRRYKKRQNAERERIERSHARNQVEIHGDPTRYQNYVKKKKFGAADEPYNGIALALRARAAMKSFLFEFGNGSNIKLRRIFRNLVRQRFIHGASAI
jgi:hypothetical protein